jgi:hypothetical protein
MIYAIVLTIALFGFMLGCILQGWKRFNVFTNLDTTQWKIYTVAFSGFLVALFGFFVAIV